MSATDRKDSDLLSMIDRMASPHWKTADSAVPTTNIYFLPTLFTMYPLKIAARSSTIFETSDSIFVRVKSYPFLSKIYPLYMITALIPENC